MLYTNDNYIDEKLVYGQAKAYKYYMDMYYPELEELNFIVSDRNVLIQDIVNT